MSEKRHIDAWGSDTGVSRPEPNQTDLPPLVDFGGFVMTAGGVAHGLTESDVEEIFTPVFAPPPRPEAER